MGQSYSQWRRKQDAAERRYDRLQAARLLGTHTKAEWLEILKRYHFRCARCGYGEQFTGWRPTKDHIIPISAGGSDRADNLQPLCRNCNTANMKDWTNWAAYRDDNGWDDAEYSVV